MRPGQQGLDSGAIVDRLTEPYSTIRTRASPEGLARRHFNELWDDAVARFDLGPFEVPDHIDVLLDDGSLLKTAAPLVGRYTLVGSL